MRYPFLLLIFLIISCSEQHVEPELSTLAVSLNGKWIEKEHRMDTIIFDPQLNSSDHSMFIFKSTNEIGGYNKLYSTIFEYKIYGDQISLYNSISSCYCFIDYRFNVKGEEMEIGNFYNPDANGSIEIFERLE